MDTQAWAYAFDQLGVHDTAARAALEAEAELRSIPAGQVIIAQDEDEDFVCILLAGEARVVLLSSGGQEIWLDRVATGSIIGELAALTGHRRSSEIAAETPCVIAVYPSTVFLDLVATHGALGLALSKLLGRRVHHTTQRMFELSALSAAGRVYAELIRKSTPNGDGRTRMISPKPQLAALARRVNTTRETVSRTISDLERRGLLKRDTTGFHLVDPDALLRLGETS